jgi:hypothetical protein
VFVITHAHRGRACVHRAACLLMANPLDVGLAQTAGSFEEAFSRASGLTVPATRRPDLCGWCQPGETAVQGGSSSGKTN